MLEAVQQFLDDRGPLELARDALDIAIVYYVTYRVLLLVKGTRAQHIGVGLLLVFALYVVAQLLELVTVLTILGSLISSIILVVVVVFQNDIRRGLIRVGSRNWMLWQAHTKESHVIDEVVEAATDLARHRIGAIIAFEQDANLDEFVGVNKGKVIDSHVSSELLVSLFVPDPMNRLHDGAVIIRNLRVAKAGVFFPMPEGKVLDQQFGSRHRAAVGITEETDAVVVVVSEERGTVSCCFNGNIAPDLNALLLREMLESIFNPRPRKRRARARVRAEGDQPSSVLTTPNRASVVATPARKEGPGSVRSDLTDDDDIATTLPLRFDSEAPPSGRITVVSEPVEGEPRTESRGEVRAPAPLRPRPQPDTDGAPQATANPPRVAVVPVEGKPMPRVDPRPAASDDEAAEPSVAPPPVGRGAENPPSGGES